MSKEVLEYDIIILGSGPAGLQAAVHASRSNMKVAVLGRTKKSSLYKAHIENYCCMNGTVTGEEILNEGRKQAEKFGAEFLEQDVLGLEKTEEGRFLAKLESGEELCAWSVILAMGVSRNRLNVPGEKELLGKGVSYCVECDGNFFRNQVVVVVGNESAACSGALHMLLLAREVHLVYSELSVSENLQYQVESSSIVKHAGRKVRAILGEGEVEGVELDNGERIEASGVFIELGAKGAMELAASLGIQLDPDTLKYITTNKKQETNITGVYAAGDICGPPWQMAKAVGEGCVAGLEAAAHARHARKQKKN
ncbi:MAG: FAD-dependent oxidoreductase [Deltaproteobacteria bacterium]|nr:FAD-dependent oxidoreductase [Deltaproteobacteria bacterium]